MSTHSVSKCAAVSPVCVATLSHIEHRDLRQDLRLQNSEGEVELVITRDHSQLLMVSHGDLSLNFPSRSQFEVCLQIPS